MIKLLAIATMVLATLSAVPLAAQDDFTAPTLLDRAREIANPVHWPVPGITLSPEVLEALTSEEAQSIAEEIFAKESHSAHERSWLFWHLVAMDYDDWVASGVIDYAADRVSAFPSAKHRLYGSPDDEFLDEMKLVGFATSLQIAGLRGLDVDDRLLELWQGTGEPSPRWLDFAAAHAADLSIEDQMAFWDAELEGYLNRGRPDQDAVAEISTRLIALSIRARTR